VKRALAMALLALGAGCSKSTPDAPPAPSAAVSVAPVGSGSGSAAGATASAPATASWTGKYTSSPGSITVPDGGEWSYVKWRGDESKDGLGEGTLALEITGNQVTGTLEGPLGPATVRGMVDGTAVTATIERKTASDKGFSGTLLGTLGATLEGSMNLSVHDAHIIRVAKFSLARK
jgi:hypothetical protein